MSSRNSESSYSRYDSAVESFVDADNNNDIDNENVNDNFNDNVNEYYPDAENLELRKTITVKSTQHDTSNIDNYIESTKNDENTYQEELENELTREATNLSRISRKLTGHSSLKDVEKQEYTQEEEEDPEIVGYDPKTCNWDSPDDPDNPPNWAPFKRWYCTMVTAFLCLVITLGSSIYVDAIPEMMVKWGVSQTLGLAGLTFYLVGLAFGPAIAAPLSELFGRNIVYCGSLPISMLFTMGVGLSPNIGSVIVLRFFAGLTSSGALAIAGGTITDIWKPQEIGLAMTLFCLAPLAGPVIGPIIGGFIGQNKISPKPNRVGGLRWAMWVDLFFAATIFIPLFIMPETYKPIIMRKRIIKRGKKLKKGMPLMQFLIVIVFITLLKPVEMLFVEPIVLVFSIYTAFVFAVLFGFFEAFPVIFRGIYRMELGVSGLPFLGVGLGLLFGAICYLCLDKFYFFKKWDDGYIGMKDKDGNPIPPTPESRLLPCMIGSVCFGPSLFWLAWTARHSVHWMAPTASGVLFGFSLVLIFFSILTYFSMAYPPISVASALAANNMTRYIVSSVFPLFTVQMMENLHVYWGVSVFAFIALAMVPVPWVFNKYGERLRNRSKYGWTALYEQERKAKLEKEKAKQDRDINSQETATFDDKE